MQKKIKNIAGMCLKCAIAVSIIVYMVQTDKLDIEQIKRVATNKVLIFELIFIIGGLYAIATLRWYFLLVWQGFQINLKSVININFTSLFFSNFMPGVIGGDLVKAYYIAKENSEERTRAVTTIIVDRVIGFGTLLVVAFVSFLINHEITYENSYLRTLFFIITTCILAVLFMGVCFFSQKGKDFFLNLCSRRQLAIKIPGIEVINKIYLALEIYSHQKRKLILAALCTMPGHLLMVYAFFLIGRFLGDQTLSFQSYLAMVPLGIVGLSIPLAPSGIGIGQGIFYHLFIWFGAESGSIGVAVITVYQAVTIALNTSFVYCYLNNKKDVKHALQRAHNESERNEAY